ncbi:hypothetical protein [Yinghuangia seranimata]|uniref:hypothetical protein n=1 Tax=Yinghuangia seranimata TaxID=408067 RepID=UPI00248B17EA|nr:hypothetical protein [Yinghuangia seranimata]MDI2132781.1 hypothetical protein [Yinghuangia seranimata]
MRDAGPTRRSVLAGLGALAAMGLGVTACTSDDGSGPTPAQRKADDAIRDRAREGSAALLGRYQAVLALHGALEGRLRPYADEIARHLEVLGGAKAAASAASATPAAPGVTPTDEPVPGTPQAALADLVSREQQAADARLVDLPAATPDLARLLASVAAANAVHAKLLGSTP